jgi:hypothetical protein
MAHNCLILAVDTNDCFYYEFPGSRADGCRAVEIPEVDWERNHPEKQQRAWIGDIKDKDAIIEAVSRNFPGEDIKVFNLVEVHTRLPGKLTMKSVSESGVLPV